MAAPGEIEEYFIVEKGGRCYVRHNRWALKAHVASFLDRDTAERISARYPGSRISRLAGYDISFRSFEELEPDASRAIENAVRLAKYDGKSLETILVTAEKAYHAVN